MLHDSIDGRRLKDSRKVPQQHQWITEGNRFLSGKDFINSIKLRINALPTKSRTSRGRTSDRTCRGGCNAVETLNHVLQQCHRTYKSRIERHNAITNYVNRALNIKNYSKVEEEPPSPRLKDYGNQISLQLTALVLDAQVVGEHINVDVAHTTKSEKYKDLREMIKKRYNVESVEFSSITLNYRGVWSSLSAKDLCEKWKILKKQEIKILSSRAAIL